MMLGNAAILHRRPDHRGKSECFARMLAAQALKIRLESGSIDAAILTQKARPSRKV